MDVADFWTLDAKCLRLTIDAFAGGALVVDAVVKRPITVQRHTHPATPFPIDIFDAAFALGELVMLARLPSLCRKEEGTLKALGAIAIGMIELLGRVHGQADWTEGNAVRQAGKRGLAVLVEWDGSNAVMEGSTLVHIPGVEGRISRHVGGIHP